jgi:hypothetical protein
MPESRGRQLFGQVGQQGRANVVIYVGTERIKVEKAVEVRKRHVGSG